MSPDLKPLVETGAAALLFAAMFLWGGRIHPLRPLFRDDRSSLSFGAGISTGYVFIHMMPEMHEARGAFTASVGMPLRYEGMAVYYVALIGFLVYYGLEKMRGKLQETAETGQVGMDFKLQVGGFAAYVWLMAYLLVHGLEGSETGTAFYAVAIAFHFLSVDHSLRDEHGAVYQRYGRPVLAGLCLLGWVVGQLVALPPYVLALLVAFISGAIIMNSTIMELPTEKDGRFLPFVSGGLIYGLILLTLT